VFVEITANGMETVGQRGYRTDKAAEKIKGDPNEN
jgi:hypothetical protein